MPLIFAFLILLFLSSQCSHAQGCNPNEDCSTCLASAFHHCIKHGNDFACEARKAACRALPIAPPVTIVTPTPFTPIVVPTKPVIPTLTAYDVKSCITNLAQCPRTVYARITYDQMAPLVDEYKASLNKQVRRWYSLPTDVITKIQQYYDLDLNNVIYAENINTGHGMNMTLDNKIYFTKEIDFTNFRDLQLLFHELEHSVQFAKRGGEGPFLAEYVTKAGWQVMQHLSLNIHDQIDLENAAISKSNTVLSAFRDIGWELHVNNKCQKPIQIAVSYLDGKNVWQTIGYYSFAPSETAYVNGNDGKRAHTTNLIYYYYAHSDDGSVVWEGDTDLVVGNDGAHHNFVKIDATGNASAFSLDLTCD